ncbi:hypothetical protein SIN07_04190 [Pediococcus inopinatus]|mgnify:CR=1 FL=1|uniref:hypothetical protein n=1 Tax=Pediococcus inopinatus TaxID=114090 RepID=UPI002A6AC2AF|nr:hypothetical protein [Pediococcus inopinatus]WPC17780.1 hypothetical protein N6G94_01800 [Pediococcus inopinatus]WPP10048.1 hypothetical protein SIN07_04190 [Pediococcus inopinatus]
MRLIDFNLSVAELDPQLKLYFKPANHPALPVSSLKLLDHWLIVEPGTTPLTLDQFETRVQAAGGSRQLAYSETNQVKLFGYQLREQKIILG